LGYYSEESFKPTERSIVPNRSFLALGLVVGGACRLQLKNKNTNSKMRDSLPVSPLSLAELYVLYGFVFQVLAVAVLLRPRRDRTLPFAAELWLLGLFGLSHGCREWGEAWLLLHPEAPRVAGWVSGYLLLLSYVFLFEFGRRQLRWPQGAGQRITQQRLLGTWIYVPLTLGVAGLAWLAEEPIRGVIAGARLCFGFPGALASGLAFLARADEPESAVSSSTGWWLRVAGIALIGYSLAAGLVVRGDSAFPGWFPTTEGVYRWLGISIQTVRMFCAFAVAAALVRIIREANAAAGKREAKALEEAARLNASLTRRVRESVAELEETHRCLQGEIEERKNIEEKLLDNQKQPETRGNGPPAMIRLRGPDRDGNFFQNEEQFRETMEQLLASERKQRELATLAQRDQSRIRALLSAMRLGILFEDREHRVEYVNPAFLRMWSIGEGFDPVGRHAHEVVEHSSRRFSRPEHASGRVLQALYPHELGESLELGFDDGRILTQASYPVTDADGRPIGRMWLYEDITHERQTAEQLLYLAERDPLTGLYNRHRFQEQLERSIAAALRNGTGFALVYFDLDEFKYVNDTFGHKAGDTVLVRIAGEVGTLVRGIDVFARLGGDEFAILSTLKPGDDPKALPARVINAIAAIPFRFRGANIRMTGSAGVAVFPEHGDNAEDLVAHADAAMYQAKVRGKNTWTVYDPQSEASEAMAKRLSWNRRMAEALEQDSFELHFQGVYDIDTLVPSHMEVLVRMRDPADSGVLVMPGQFLPAAEKSGQIGDIDRWVLARSIALLGQDSAMPPLAVNISGRTFDDPFLPQFIRGKLLEHRVDPGRLILELTEAAVVADIQAAQRFIEAVCQAGCRVCLDGFGSGFATFGYLKFLGAELFKIDGVFIRDLPNNPENQVFVKAMVDVAHGLKKTLVAEFVEDAATLALIQALGVPLVQGYHLDRPAARPSPHPLK
jgi:diguanylate cyclase (GGDEF)-like protein